MEILNTEVYGLYPSIKRSGYPMRTGDIVYSEDADDSLKRAVKLGKCKSGSGHDNMLKGIIVQFDIKYPQYWSMQAQRYHWFDIVSSQSKMHTLVKTKLSLKNCNPWVFDETMDRINCFIDIYNDKEDYPIYLHGDYHGEIKSKYDLYMIIISNLPMGYEMWMGVSTNYLQLKTIYQQRKSHKLKDDWGYFCEWLEILPYFMVLTGNEGKKTKAV